MGETLQSHNPQFYSIVHNLFWESCSPTMSVSVTVGPDNLLFYLHNVGWDGSDIWGQSVLRLTKQDWDTFSLRPKREFNTFLTNSDWTILVVGDDGVYERKTRRSNLGWSYKNDSCLVHVGSDSDAVLAGLLDGSSLHQRDVTHVEGELFATQQSKSVSDFNNRETGWYTNKELSNGVKKIIRWHPNKMVVTASNDDERPQWCLDTCWHEVPLTKNTAQLIKGIEAGHNILIKSGNILAAARDIVVYEGHVTATLKEHWSPSDQSSFSEHSEQVWQSVSSQGEVTSCKHQPESSTVTSYTREYLPSRWFLDSRSWRMILSINSKGTVISGSKSDLIVGIKSSKELRLGIRHDNGLLHYMSVDTVVWRDSGEVAAEVIQLPGLELGKDSRFSLYSNCRTWAAIITTEGKYKVYEYTLGNIGKHEVKTGVVSIDWFVY